jgi:hypothetical protein
MAQSFALRVGAVLLQFGCGEWLWKRGESGGREKGCRREAKGFGREWGGGAARRKAEERMGCSAAEG